MFFHFFYPFGQLYKAKMEELRIESQQPSESIGTIGRSKGASIASSQQISVAVVTEFIRWNEEATSRVLVSEGIFDIVADVLQSEDKKLILTGHPHSFLKSGSKYSAWLRESAGGGSLFGLLVKNMLTDFGDDMHCQFVEILHSLLDSYTFGSQRDTIVEIFYEKTCAGEINSKCSDSDGGPRNQSYVKPEILLSICDLLCFCVLHHPYRIN